MPQADEPRTRNAGMETPAGTPAEITLVLPVFNEEANLAPLLTRVQESLGAARISYRVVAVDDGSTDSTAVILRSFGGRMPLLVCRHERNQGLGAALRDGLREAVRLCGPDDVIVTMDADDTHDPALIGGMLRQIRRGFDVSIASRYQPGARCFGVPLHRRLLSYGASILFRLAFPTEGVRDYTCGYRAYRARVLRDAMELHGDSFLKADGFQCMVDVLFHLRALNVRFTETPVNLHYDQKRGASKMRVARTIRDTLLLMARRRMKSPRRSA